MKYRVGLKQMLYISQPIEAKNKRDARRQLRELAEINKLNYNSYGPLKEFIEEIKS